MILDLNFQDILSSKLEKLNVFLVWLRQKY